MTLDRIAKSSALTTKLSEMRLKLSPLVRITTGAVHAAFPKTLLHYWLLTESELDGLADFYHQKEWCRWTDQYPKAMGWREGMGLEEKRRRWGKFIGLRGCETPKSENESMDWETLMMQRVREGREEEEMMRRKTQGFW